MPPHLSGRTGVGAQLIDRLNTLGQNDGQGEHLRWSWAWVVLVGAWGACTYMTRFIW